MSKDLKLDLKLKLQKIWRQYLSAAFSTFLSTARIDSFLSMRRTCITINNSLHILCYSVHGSIIWQLQQFIFVIFLIGHDNAVSDIYFFLTFNMFNFL